MKYLLFLALAISSLCSSLDAQYTQPLPPPISGVVYSQRNGNLPGVTVSLVNSTVGRGSPSVSDLYGRYFFMNVPYPQRYYIEAYWGTTLVYRGIVDYNGQSIRMDIPLP
jgi:hypothetical protein